MADEQERKYNERISAGKGDASVLIPAATVTLLRDGADGLETIMLRKNSKIAFGGMWVFPGGRVDDDDGEPGDAKELRARIAAAREAEEEASLSVDPAELVWFAHWTPPPVEIRRFSTWFFAARAPEGDVQIDDGEITDSQWIRPADALAKQRERAIELVPPTFVTLHQLGRYRTVDEALAGLGRDGPRTYVTQIVRSDEGMVALWQGDAGYEACDASIEGPRHRLVMTKQGFRFDDSGLG
jgi:8-oxo-dGTP pyrophosphatase MutT (NUDIX family)